MSRRPYYYGRCSSDPEIAYPTWRIYKDDQSLEGEIVWHCRDDGRAYDSKAPYPPQEVRDEYERLLREAGWSGSADPTPDMGRMFNAGLWGSEFDQPCKWGQNCDGYAVYCTNDAWLYKTRKCTRNRDDWKHEDCEGFCANPNATKAEGVEDGGEQGIAVIGDGDKD